MMVLISFSVRVHPFSTFQTDSANEKDRQPAGPFHFSGQLVRGS
jgi:hypothetical protein